MGKNSKKKKGLKHKIYTKIVLPAIGLTCIVFIVIIVGTISIIAGGNSAAKSSEELTYDTLSEQVEAYRYRVQQAARDEGIEEYTNHLLCIMQVSTQGIGTDVMNAGEFDSNLQYPKERGMISDPQYSIVCGIQEFKTLLSLVGVKDANDTQHLLVVYQTYHLNRRYISFSGGIYTPENAQTFLDSVSFGDQFNVYFAQQVNAYLTKITEGGSAENNLFIYPLQNYHSISSPFGYRDSPTMGNYELHSGTDFPAPKNTPVLASADGIVEAAGWSTAGYGNRVMIRHNVTYVTLYAHNTSLAVSVGQHVKQGDVIAYVGSTGNSTGNHCHFEIRVNGKCVDPMLYLEGNSQEE